MKKFKDIIVKKTANMPSRRKQRFEQEYGLEENGAWTGSFDEGMKVLEKHFYSRFRTISDGLKKIEDVYGTAKWVTMSIRGVVTSDLRLVDHRIQREENSLRSDVIVDGYVVQNSVPVQFRYMQGDSKYSGQRYYRYNNSSLRLFNTLGLKPGDAAFRDDPYVRARDRAPPR